MNDNFKSNCPDLASEAHQSVYPRRDLYRQAWVLVFKVLKTNVCRLFLDPVAAGIYPLVDEAIEGVGKTKGASIVLQLDSSSPLLATIEGSNLYFLALADPRWERQGSDYTTHAPLSTKSVWRTVTY